MILFTPACSVTASIYSTNFAILPILIGMEKKKHTTYYLTEAAFIAALYLLLTWLSNLLGLANGQVQIRFSEALCILPIFTVTAVPGLFVGCLLANILTGAALPDIIVGSLATLAAAYLTYKLRRHSKYICVIPPIAINVIVIPLLLYFVYGFVPLWLSFITVFAGELVSAGVLGIALYNVLSKYRHQVFPHET